MSYLIDTNVLSESYKQNADKNVEAWLMSIPNKNLYISVMTIGEICYGISKLPNSRKKDELQHWLEFHIPEWFEDRILTIDITIINIWGKLRVNHKTLPTIDSLLAASAISHNLTIVTRNIKDFQNIEGLTVLNPWESH